MQAKFVDFLTYIKNKHTLSESTLAVYKSFIQKMQDEALDFTKGEAYTNAKLATSKIKPQYHKICIRLAKRYQVFKNEIEAFPQDTKSIPKKPYNLAIIRRHSLTCEKEESCRYRLSFSLQNTGTETITFVLMYPSGADAKLSDPMTQSMIAYVHWLRKVNRKFSNIGNINIVNVSPFIRVENKLTDTMITGNAFRKNKQTIKGVFKETDYIVGAWGKCGNSFIDYAVTKFLEQHVLAMMEMWNEKLYLIGDNGSGIIDVQQTIQSKVELTENSNGDSVLTKYSIREGKLWKDE